MIIEIKKENVFYEWDSFPLIFNFEFEDKLFMAVCINDDNLDFKFAICEITSNNLIDFKNDKIKLFELFENSNNIAIITLNMNTYKISKWENKQFNEISNILP